MKMMGAQDQGVINSRRFQPNTTTRQSTCNTPQRPQGINELLLLKIDNFCLETGKSVSECLTEAIEIWYDCIAEVELESYRKLAALDPIIAS
jgi:hypothetical protein